MLLLPQGSSDLTTLVQIMCATFAENCPVYSKAAARPPPQQAYSQPRYPPQPQQYQQPQQQRPPYGVCIHPCVCVCVCVCIHVYVHVHVHACVHYMHVPT